MTRWFNWLLGALLLCGVLGSFWRLSFPNELVFDERYHVPAARAVLQGDWRIFDWWQPPLAADGSYADWLHPPLFKYFQAGSIAIFGDGPIGWRFPSALAGLAIIWLGYLLATQLSGQRAGWIAATLLALSGLRLVQSRTGMNDAVVTAFILAAAWSYAKTIFSVKKITPNRGQWLQIGLWLGLAVATKWTGLLAVLAVVLLQSYYQFRLWQNTRAKKRKAIWAWWPWKALCVLFVPAVIFILSYLPLFWSGRDLNHLVTLQQKIWQYHLQRDHAHSEQSTPVAWLLNLQPVTYWKASVTPIHLRAYISTLEQPMLVILLLAALAGVAVWWKKGINSQLKFLSWWFVLLWLPFIFSPRILFHYHFLPAEMFGIVLVAVVLAKVKTQVWLNWLIAAVGVCWLIFYPHWVGLPVPFLLVERVYWLLPSWP